MRRTKILATIGPSSETEAVLRKMIRAGLNAVRCNFSHGTPEDHQRRVALVRKIAEEEGVKIGILGDLQGPKIRVAKFKNDFVMLEAGETFVIDAGLDKNLGDIHQVGTDYAALPTDVKPGDILLLDDGKLVFEVSHISGQQVHCKIIVGGKLSNNKGINKKGGGLTAPALTEKDKENIKIAAQLNMDFVAVSFPRDAADMHLARKLLHEAGSQAALVAKIERTEAINNIDAIIEASEICMVARGDLAVEIGEEYVPGAQKAIIQRCRELDKMVITATQMMESMIESPTPTRAEVSDVANAVLDGTDAVMLSAESASGHYPVEAIKAMDRVCRAAEVHPSVSVSRHRVECHFERIDEAVAMAAMYTANHLDARAIIALTESGSTPLWMSRISSNLPIYALTPNTLIAGLMTLCRGVEPIIFDSTSMQRHEVNKAAVELLVKRNYLQDNEVCILTSGDNMGLSGGTNKMKILTVGAIA